MVENGRIKNDAQNFSGVIVSMARPFIEMENSRVTRGRAQVVRKDEFSLRNAFNIRIYVKMTNIQLYFVLNKYLLSAYYASGTRLGPGIQFK